MTIKELKTETVGKKTVYVAILNYDSKWYYDNKKFPHLKVGDEVDISVSNTPKGLPVFDFFVKSQAGETPQKEEKSNVYLDVARKEEARREKYISNNEAMKLAADVYKTGNVDSEKTIAFYKDLFQAMSDTIDEIAGS